MYCVGNMVFGCTGGYTIYPTSGSFTCGANGGADPASGYWKKCACYDTAASCTFNTWATAAVPTGITSSNMNSFSGAKYTIDLT